MVDKSVFFVTDLYILVLSPICHLLTTITQLWTLNGLDKKDSLSMKALQHYFELEERDTIASEY